MGGIFLQYFQSTEALRTPVPITESVSANYEVSPPKYNQICTINNKLKSNKAAGSDNISPNLINKKRKKNCETEII
jgi:hypothetical protein